MVGARTLNPDIQIVIRSHNVEEASLLEREGTGTVFVGESELAKSMVRHLLKVVGVPVASSARPVENPANSASQHAAEARAGAAATSQGMTGAW